MPQTPDENSIKKILVIRFSSLGDIILTFPLLKSLRKTYPDSVIHYCTKEEYRDTANTSADIDKTITVGAEFDFARLKLLKQTLLNGNYDLVIDAHNNIRTRYLRFFLSRKSRVLKLKKYSLSKFLLVKFKWNKLKNAPPVAKRYIDILGLADTTENIAPEILPNDFALSKVKEELERAGVSAAKKLVVIVPSTKHFTKTYPQDYFAKLIDKFDDTFEIALIGKGNDVITIKKIASSVERNVIDLSNLFNTAELAELMRSSSLVITGDTGPMHIAEAVNASLLMIAGSSVKELGFYPQNKNSAVVENTGLDCRPCSHIGRSSCPKGHFKCMMELTPEIVFQKTMILIK